METKKNEWCVQKNKTRFDQCLIRCILSPLKWWISLIKRTGREKREREREKETEREWKLFSLWKNSSWCIHPTPCGIRSFWNVFLWFMASRKVTNKEFFTTSIEDFFSTRWAITTLNISNLIPFGGRCKPRSVWMSTYFYFAVLVWFLKTL